MIWVKSSLFILIIVTVKFIFRFINDYGDRRVKTMKELLNFIDYLRIYSCDMKLSLEEINLKFNFQSEQVKKICNELQNEITHAKNKNKIEDYMKELLNTPNDFNKYFTDIMDYYGSTYSDVLDKKLHLTIKEMEDVMKVFERSHNEKKNLNNRISVLVGCLTAIILI